MTAAAGIPIASLIHLGQKNPGQSSTLTAPSAKSATASIIPSFRAGLEALVKTAQSSAADPVSSDAVKDELAKAGPSVETSAKANLPGAIATLSKPAAPPATQTLQASPSLRSIQSTVAASAPQQPAFDKTSDSLAAAPAVGSPTNKSAGSNHATQTKSAHDTGKPSAPTSPTSHDGVALAPVPLSAINLAAVPASQPQPHTVPTAAASCSAATAKSSSALSTSLATESEPALKNAPAAPSMEEPASISTTKTQAAHTATIITEAATQTTSAHTSTSPQPSSDDLALQSQMRNLSGQPASSNTAVAVESTAAQQAHAASAHTSAVHDRATLQHSTTSDAAVQNFAGAHTPLARDAAGISNPSAERGASATTTAQAQTTSSSSTTRDTFAALDADPGQPATTWTHSSPRQVEAGYQDPALGWVSVRADLTSGGLHASVVPNSPEAAQALGSHLAGLNAYLSEHHGSSITASLASPEDRSGQNSGQQSAMDSNTQSGPRHDQSSQSSAEPLSAQTSTALGTSIQQHSEPALFTPTHNGRISVLA